MREARVVGFQKHLDPRAQEFRPRNPLPHYQINLLLPHSYYPYPFSYSPIAVPVTSHVCFAAGNPPLPPALPPPSAGPTRVLLLSSVPTDVSEETVREDLEVFGEVRAIQMGRLPEGIVTVHFYDSRHAQEAMAEIQEQHMQQQYRLRRYYDALLFGHLGFEGHSLGVPVTLPAPGLIAGRAVWAQFTLPDTIDGPDGYNQGTLVIFNWDSGASPSKLEEMFEAIGPVKELRKAPSKQQQRFVEFFDIRDAARALSELNGKEVNGKQIIIKFSHPGGYGKMNATVTAATTTATTATVTAVNSVDNIYSTKLTNSKNDICPPPIVTERVLYSHSSLNAPPPSHLSQTSLSAKKLSFSRENSSRKSNGRSNYGSVVASMTSPSLIKGGKDYTRPSGRNSKNVNNNHNLPTKKQLQQPKSRPWKGGQKDSDAHFLINEDAVIESNFRDTRTTVMIKNIPNKYSQKLLLNMLDNHCIHCNERIADGDDQPLSSYDFVYLPIDFNNNCNMGYGFVNLTSPQATWRFYKAFHSHQWEVFNSRKICEVTFARLQGLEALKEHFKNSKFACVTDEYLPVVFCPPRDGKRLTDAVPLVSHSTPVVNKKLIGCCNGKHEGKGDGERLEDGGDYGDNEDDICNERLKASDHVDHDSGVSPGIKITYTPLAS